MTMKGKKKGEETVEQRFWSKVNKTDSCWLWTACKTKAGYGLFNPTHDKPVYAHRLAYEWAKGSIPQGMQLDHLCRIPTCVNPDHLEPVTNRENSLRGRNPNVIRHHEGVCLKGHQLTPDNVYKYKRGKNGFTTICRICQNQRTKQAYQRRKLRDESC